MAASSIKVLVNADELLRHVAAHGAQTVADVARGMSIPRPSVYRLVDALVQGGWLAVDADNRVRLATDILRLAALAKAQNPLVRAAEEPLRDLRDLTGQTVYLCARRGDEVVCLERLQGLSVGLLELVPGGTLPPHAGAAARAIAAYDATLRHVAVSGGLPTLTERTMTSAEDLEEDSRRVRERGYSLSDGDVTAGVAALGVPVRSPGGDLAGAVSLAGMRDEILRDVPGAVAALRAAAERITADLEAARG